jgi:FkbM family methyltransferase
VNPLIRKLAGPKIQKLRRTLETKSWRYTGLQRAMPHVTCVDVGASYFPHTSLWFFLGSKKTNWYAVEPNEQNLTYVKNWPWIAKLSPVTTGLSETGGLQTLFITNVDSGSSLLEPRITETMSQRLGDAGSNYFYPYTEVKIETITLSDVLALNQKSVPAIIKLDTQGSELSILRGALSKPEGSQIIAIEMESSLLNEPTYRDSPRLWEAAAYLESFDFEMLSLDVFPRYGSVRRNLRKPRIAIDECDVIFCKKRSALKIESIEYRMAVLGVYITYGFHQEALFLLEEDERLRDHLMNSGINPKTILKRF